MFNRGLLALTGESTVIEAWRSLVKAEDVVGVKVHASPGPVTGTRPAVVSAIVQGLLEAGQEPGRIVIWDRRMADLRMAGFVELAASLGVRVAGAVEEGFDGEVAYENSVLGQLVHGDLEFNRAARADGTVGASGVAGARDVVGRRSHLTRLLTGDVTRLVVVAPLLNHNHVGVNGILYTMASASTDNFHRFDVNPMLLATAVPEIFGQTNIADRVAVNVVDALLAQYEGQERSLLHYAGALNELRLSQDPVALDVLSLQDLERLRAVQGAARQTNRFELFVNARLLELGTDDLSRVDMIRVEP
jgi:hypothetical protein